MKKITVLLLCIVSFIAIILQTACSAGGAGLPQTSLPLPENDPVTVSSPDADGIVVVTGSALSVPADSTVIVEVTSSISFFRIQKYIDSALFAVAQATTCESSLPVCPSLSSDNKCQYTASTDGSFSLTVPATLQSSIAISYLDTSTCEEVSAYTETVETNVISVNFDVVDSVYIDDFNKLYMVGSDSTGYFHIVSYDFATGTQASYLFDTTIQNPVSLNEFEDHLNNHYMVITLLDKVLVGGIATDGSLVSSDFVRLIDESGNDLSGAQFLMASNNVYSSEDTCVSASLFDSSDTSFTRVVVVQNATFFVFEFVLGLNDVDPSYRTTDGIQPRAVSYASTAEISTAEGDVMSLSGIDVMEQINDYFVMLLSFSAPVEGHDIYVLARRDVTSLCNSLVLDFATMDTMQLGQVANGYSSNFLSGFNDIGDAATLFGFVKKQEQIATYLDVSSTSMQCTEDHVLFLSDTLTDQYNDCLDTPGTEGIDFDLSTLSAENIVSSFLFYQSSSSPELFFIGEEGGGGDFIAETGQSVTFETDQVVDTITPSIIGYDSTDNSLLILDAGIESDGLSNIVIYPLAATPTNY